MLIVEEVLDELCLCVVALVVVPEPLVHFVHVKVQLFSDDLGAFFGEHLVLCPLLLEGFLHFSGLAEVCALVLLEFLVGDFEGLLPRKFLNILGGLLVGRCGWGALLVLVFFVFPRGGILEGDLDQVLVVKGITTLLRRVRFCEVCQSLSETVIFGYFFLLPSFRGLVDRREK